MEESFGSSALNFLGSLIPKRGTCGCTAFSRANTASLTLTIFLALFSMLLANYYFDNFHLIAEDIFEEEELETGKTDEKMEKIKAMNEAEMTHQVWM